MTELTDLSGVGPARSDYLVEAGYETPADIAEAEAEAVSEAINAPEDTALELIVQSQNVIAEEESEVEARDPDPEAESITVSEGDSNSRPDEDDSDEGEDTDSEDSADGSEEDTPNLIEFEIEFEEGLQYDTLFDSVMQQRSKMYQANRSGVEVFDHALEQMRTGGVSEPVELEMTEQQLNDLHNSVRQKVIEYKGNNLIDHMDALNAVFDQIEAVRSEYLF